MTQQQLGLWVQDQDAAAGRLHAPILVEATERAAPAGTVRIGTAGWGLPLASAAAFPGEGTHLARYARVLRCAEINSSFYRSHRQSTYARWAAQTGPGFRFSVKLPRTITHQGRLRNAAALLTQFLDEVGGLGDKLGVVLVQLPPSLAFDAPTAAGFFGCLREHHAGAVVCEPRHPSWFAPAAEALLVAWRVARAGADPARVAAAARPGGWLGDAGEPAGGAAVVYQRWHGTPRIYYSRYDGDWLRQRASEVAALPRPADCWCIFDNTAAGAAIENALELQALLDSPPG